MVDITSDGVLDIETLHAPITSQQKIRFGHTQGSVWVTGSSAHINAIRAILMKSVDYPGCILPVVPLSVELDTGLNTVRYYGYGEQDVTTTTNVWCSYEPNPSEIVLLFSNFQFYLDPYIIHTDDGVIYLDPYYFYVGKSHVRLHIARNQIDPMIARLDERFPYLRFGRYNAEVYNYIKTVRR